MYRLPTKQENKDIRSGNVKKKKKKSKIKMVQRKSEIDRMIEEANK